LFSHIYTHSAVCYSYIVFSHIYTHSTVCYPYIVVMGRKVQHVSQSMCAFVHGSLHSIVFLFVCSVVCVCPYVFCVVCVCPCVFCGVCVCVCGIHYHLCN